MNRRLAGVLALLAGCATSALPACSGDATPSESQTESTSALSDGDVSADRPVPPPTAQPAPSPVATSPTTTIAPAATDSSETARLTVGNAAELGLLEAPDHVTKFPLKVSPDGEHLVDQNGTPFLVTGDAAWSLLAQLDIEETDDYLEQRRQQGFTTLLVNLIEHRFSDDPPNNAFGDSPFLAPGDFSRPNPVYFAAARRTLERASAAGFLVLLAPAYLGYEGGEEGWYQDMVAAGPDVLRGYGRFVGEQFGDLDNVVWVQGGDFTIPTESLDLVEAVHGGIVDSGSTQLQTAHWSPETSATDVDIEWLDLNTTYTYGPVHVASRDDDGVDGLPHVMIESRYEADAFDDITTQRLRAQAYESILTGAVGSIYGHGDVWQFSSNWRASLDAPGADDMTHAAAFFESFSWFDLVPTGSGDLMSDRGDPAGADFVTVAATADRSTIAAYLPVVRDLQLDLEMYTGTLIVNWFDPTNGTFVSAVSSLENGRRLDIVAPGPNAEGDADWVVLVRVTN